MNCLVTGACGFIGSHLVDRLLQMDHQVLNLDALTYAADPTHHEPCLDHPGYRFVHCDLATSEQVPDLVAEFQPDRVFHLAAETHVDRSITGPKAFLESNITATFQLLEALRSYLNRFSTQTGTFRLIHVSTDEVFGQLGTSGSFREESPYHPRSPYSATKAAADHLIQAWQATYGLPAIITRSCNNYGPRQHPEKLIPKVIQNALHGTPIPIYGDGTNLREWIHVEDHVDALLQVAERGKTGQSYHIGSGEECSNLDLARRICKLLDQAAPHPSGTPYATRIQFVDDRPGHDFRYALSCSRIHNEIGWKPMHTLATGLPSTITHLLTPDS